MFVRLVIEPPRLGYVLFCKHAHTSCTAAPALSSPDRPLAESTTSMFTDDASALSIQRILDAIETMFRLLEVVYPQASGTYRSPGMF